MQAYTQGSSSLSFSTAMNIRNISDIHQSILGSLSNNGATQLEIDPEAQVDLSFVQLLEAARTFAGQQGSSLQLAKPAEGNLLDVLQRGGFLDDMSPDAAKFWLHQETV